MLFAVTWRGRPEVRDVATERFLKGGGTPPPEVKFIGRWHYIGQMAGIAVVETDDPLLVSRWALDWSDLFEIEVLPVITDEQLGPVLAQSVGKL